MRLALLCISALIFTTGFGGPFRPPEFEKAVLLTVENQDCVATIKGTWPNLPHNPVQWFVGGRTELLVTVHSKNGRGRHSAEQTAVYYTWPKSPSYKLEGVSGYIEFQDNRLRVELSQTLDGKAKVLEVNGSYVVSNPDACL